MSYSCFMSLMFSISKGWAMPNPRHGALLSMCESQPLGVVVNTHF